MERMIGYPFVLAAMGFSGYFDVLRSGAFR